MRSANIINEVIVDKIMAATAQKVSIAVSDVFKRIDQVESRIAEIPAGPKGEKGDTGVPDQAMVDAALSEIAEDFVKGFAE